MFHAIVFHMFAVFRSLLNVNFKYFDFMTVSFVLLT